MTKAEHRVRIDMVDGFEYTLAEVGRGWTKVSNPIQFELADSYAQRNSPKSISAKTG